MNCDDSDSHFGQILLLLFQSFPSSKLPLWFGPNISWTSWKKSWILGVVIIYNRNKSIITHYFRASFSRLTFRWLVWFNYSYCSAVGYTNTIFPILANFRNELLYAYLKTHDKNLDFCFNYISLDMISSLLIRDATPDMVHTPHDPTNDDWPLTGLSYSSIYCSSKMS